jgi:hypothetical protein
MLAQGRVERHQPQPMVLGNMCEIRIGRLLVADGIREELDAEGRKLGDEPMNQPCARS